MVTEQTRNGYRLQKKDVSKVGMVLADAFQEDPVWREVLAESKTD